MILLVLTAHMDIKRVLFLIPWLFLAMGITTLSSTARYPKLAASAIAVIVITGWLGITLRTHYATTNLYEPWGQVAQTVAEDARRGATIVSPSPSFFFYLNYQLGLEAKTNTATWAYLGEDMYRSSGYKILSPNDPQARPDSLRGKVVLVRGTGDMNNVRLEDALNDALHNRCFALGEYRAAPDPAVSFKRRFARNAPLLIYRTDVIWYNCPDAGK
jgi:hypothetical protein